MARIERFEEIEAWQTAREMTRLVYQLTNQGAFARDFGLRDQMRRAAVSAMSNTAEGFESRTRTLFVEFLGRIKDRAVKCERRPAWRLMPATSASQNSMRLLAGLRNAAVKSATSCGICGRMPTRTTPFATKLLGTTPPSPNLNHLINLTNLPTLYMMQGDPC